MKMKKTKQIRRTNRGNASAWLKGAVCLLLCAAMLIPALPVKAAPKLKGYIPYGHFSGGMLVVRDDKKEKYGFLDKKGNVAVKPKYTFANDFSGGLAAVQKGSKWGYIDKKGREVVKPQYDTAQAFSEGVAAVKKGGKWSIINQKGRTVANLGTKYEWVSECSEGMLAVGKNGKAGFINKKGREVVRPQYEYCGN